MNIVRMTVRDPFAPAGTSAAPDGLGALTNPYLGWQLLGYSRRRTNALLDAAANMIEQLASDVAEQRGALADAGSRLARAEAALKDTTARLEASREELARIRTEQAKETGESDAEAAGKALVSAHREAADVVARARDEAARILSSARADATGADEEADHLIEQAEIRAHDSSSRRPAKPSGCAPSRRSSGGGSAATARSGRRSSGAPSPPPTRSSSCLPGRPLPTLPESCERVSRRQRASPNPSLRRLPIRPTPASKPGGRTTLRSPALRSAPPCYPYRSGPLSCPSMGRHVWP